MRALILLLALPLAACGGEPRQPAEAPAGMLEVRMALPDGPIFIEGSLPTVRVERLEGGVVLEEQTPVETLDEPLLERSLAAGSYVVDVVQQPCQGNCGILDAVDEGTRCRVRTALEPERTTVVTIRLRRAGRDGERVVCDGTAA